MRENEYEQKMRRFVAGGLIAVRIWDRLLLEGGVCIH